MSIDRSTTPYKIDIGLDDMGDGFRRYDTVKGRFHISKMKGIFQIKKHPTDDTKDRLKWCFAMPGKSRPTEFNAQPESGHKLVELERFILDESDAAEKLRAAGADVKLNYPNKWIETLTLDNSGDENAPLETFRALRKLKNLNLDAANIEIAKSLSENIALMSLKLDCEVDPVVLQELAKSVPQLRSIGMRCATLTRAHGKALAQFESLTSLTIANNEARLDGLNELAGSKIRILKFHNCNLIEDGLKVVETSLPDVGVLEIRRCELADSDVRPISRMHQLRSLVLRNCDISDEGIRNLKSLPELYSLNIDGTSVTNASLELVLQNFPELYWLSARNVKFDEGIIPLVANVDRQMSIYVSESSVSQSQAKAAGEKVAKILRR